MMKLLYVTNLPSPYRVDFFNCLSGCAEVKVIYERASSTERDSEWVNREKRRFSEEYASLRPFGTDKSVGTDLIKRIKKEKFRFLIISGYASPSVMLLIWYCKIKRIPYYLESDGGFFRTDAFPKKLFKRSLICAAAGIFTTCREMEAYYKYLGCRGAVYRVPLSSVSQAEVFEAPADEREKQRLRARLGITEKQMILSVGRFSYQNGYGKGYDCLLRAAKRLRDASIGWYIVGGEPTEEFKRMKEQMGLDNVHFEPFQSKENLKPFYRAADIFALMTVGDVWGLVINEAFACGLPVLTTDRCIAGQEMVENGENGYLLPVGDDAALAERAGQLLRHPEDLARIAENNIQKASLWTIETMASARFRVLQEIDKAEQA